METWTVLAATFNSAAYKKRGRDFLPSRHRFLAVNYCIPTVLISFTLLAAYEEAVQRLYTQSTPFVNLSIVLRVPYHKPKCRTAEAPPWTSL